MIMMQRPIGPKRWHPLLNTIPAADQRLEGLCLTELEGLFPAGIVLHSRLIYHDMTMIGDSMYYREAGIRYGDIRSLYIAS